MYNKDYNAGAVIGIILSYIVFFPFSIIYGIIKLILWRQEDRTNKKLLEEQILKNKEQEKQATLMKKIEDEKKLILQKEDFNKCELIKDFICPYNPPKENCCIRGTLTISCPHLRENERILKEQRRALNELNCKFIKNYNCELTYKERNCNTCERRKRSYFAFRPKYLDEKKQISKPYESFKYMSHCFKCASPINSDYDNQCEECGWYICSVCGACNCRF